jgi:hypothetical protein
VAIDRVQQQMQVIGLNHDQSVFVHDGIVYLMFHMEPIIKGKKHILKESK